MRVLVHQAQAEREAKKIADAEAAAAMHFLAELEDADIGSCCLSCPFVLLQAKAADVMQIDCPFMAISCVL